MMATKNIKNTRKLHKKNMAIKNMFSTDSDPAATNELSLT